MNKDIKIILIMLLLAVVFVCGLKVGEYHAIHHQRIEKSENGYYIEFDGEFYNYE